MADVKIPTKLVAPAPEFEEFRIDMLAVLKRHSGDLPADKMLAIAAYTVGQLIAMQDQRSITPEMAMHLVGENIDLGNAHAIKETFGSPKGNG